MLEWSAQRRFPRYLIQLPLLHREIAPAAVKAGVGWTRNLGEGGAGVDLADPLRPGMPLRLRLQTDRGAIEVEARVIWIGEPGTPGGVVPHGMAFTQVASDQLQALRDLLLSKGEVRHAGVRLPLELSITCQCKGEMGLPLQGWTGDISRGGLLLRLPQVLPPGTVLELTLHTPNEPIAVEGTIVWVEPPERRSTGEPIGHGFRFIAFDGSLSMSLGLLLAEPL
jgi:Tfp pilus assembly protein PilZ